MEENISNKSTLPAIIVLVVIVVVVGFLLTKAKVPPATKPAVQQAGSAPTEPPFDPASIPAVSAQDYIKGSATATTTIVLYSDTQCPYCRVFYPELKKVLSENPDVRLVYRPTPFKPTGQVEEKAMDCANDQGKYWEYLDAIYTSTDTENIIDPARLAKIGTDLGLDGTVFSQCLSSDKYGSKTQIYLDAARVAKITGTPTSIIIGPKGATPIRGAVGADQLAKVVNSVK
ncbi:MAG: thioredoxin domain-containing protein [bacterium]|nr:thioredoxin domain-containing protein [bacterium]